MSTDKTPPKSRKVLLCLDLSEHSSRALSWYLADFHAPGDEVTLLHVLEPPSFKGTFLGVSSTHMANEYDMTMAQVNHEFDDLKQLFYQQSANIVPRHKTHIVSAHGTKPGYLAIEYLEKHPHDVVIVGNRGRSRARRVFLGSVSEHILHHAHCPVAVVPPPNDDCFHHVSTASLNVDSINLHMCKVKDDDSHDDRL